MKPIRSFRANLLGSAFVLAIALPSLSIAQETAGNLNIDAMWGYRAPTQYTIIPRPATHFNKGEPNTAVVSVPNIRSRPSEPYAYGWFGAKPSPQWSRQFGFHKAYTQWTLK